MQKFVCYITTVFLILTAKLKPNSADDAEGRLFGYTYTTTVTATQLITSLVPSSCVMVEATLPPCRNMRYLKFPKLPTISFNNPLSKNWRVDPNIKSTALAWGEYLGLYAPTVTVTATDIRVTTMQDPSVVVTFAIKGCRPLSLPMDLDRCQLEYPSVNVEETLKTSTVASIASTILPTETVPNAGPTTTSYLVDLPSTHFQDNSNLLEPSAQEISENGAVKPTATLG